MATALGAAWGFKILDGSHQVEAAAVVDKLALPSGLNSKAINNTVVLVHTPAGMVEVQVGDVLVRPCGIADGECLRLPYDQAAARLTEQPA